MKKTKRNILFYIIEILSILIFGLGACFIVLFLTTNIFNNTINFLYTLLGICIFGLIISFVRLIVDIRKRSILNIEKYKPIINALSKYVFEYDVKTKKFTISKDLAKFIGSKKTIVDLKDISNLFEGAEKPLFNYDQLREEESFRTKLKTKNGKYVSLSFFPTVLGSKKIIVGYLNDFTLEYIEEQSLLKAAQQDTLTETYRKSYFIKEVKEKMENSTDKAFLIYIDIDNFKSINDKYGHSYGDIVLLKLSVVLKNYCRKKNALLSRCGGDEFLIYVTDIADYSKVNDFCSDLIYAVKTISVPEIGLKHVYISMGVAFYPSHSDNYEMLLRYADDALYKSKGILGSAYTIYDQDKIHNELNIANKEVVEGTNEPLIDLFKDLQLGEVSPILMQAIENKEIKLLIQPEISLSNDDIYGECLCRWYKDGKLVLPFLFLPYFERTGLIFELDLHIFEETLKIAAKNIKKGDKTQLSFNQSLKSIIDPGYNEKIKTIFNKYKKQYIPGTIAVEITEKVMFNGLRNIKKALELYKELGIKVVIDDFGTGFTSLAIIKDLDVDMLKIDRSFLDNPSHNKKKCEYIISGINKIGKTLGISTILEGIETVEDYKVAMTSKIDFVQGYLFDKAIKSEDFFDNIKKEVYKNKKEELSKTIK